MSLARASLVFEWPGRDDLVPCVHAADERQRKRWVLKTGSGSCVPVWRGVKKKRSNEKASGPIGRLPAAKTVIPASGRSKSGKTLRGAVALRRLLSPHPSHCMCKGLSHTGLPSRRSLPLSAIPCAFADLHASPNAFPNAARISERCRLPLPGFEVSGKETTENRKSNPNRNDLRKIAC